MPFPTSQKAALVTYTQLTISPAALQHRHRRLCPITEQIVYQSEDKRAECFLLVCLTILIVLLVVVKTLSPLDAWSGGLLDCLDDQYHFVCPMCVPPGCRDIINILSL